MLTLAYGCGLRAGEVVRLRAGDIDSEQKIIRIVQSKGRRHRAWKESSCRRPRECQIFCVRGLCEGCIAVVSCISRTSSSIPWWLTVAGQQALSRP
jgi:hypothetical protein